MRWRVALEAMRSVGPVLQASELGRAVLEAIQALNSEVSVLDQGAYYRVQVPGICVLTRAAVEQITGRPFRLPSDLELVMPAFQGFLQFGVDRVEWRSVRQ
jgi:toluene monooxygenase system protein D